MSEDLIDRIALEILEILDENPEGLRFKDFKGKIPASDPVISRRLSLLKRYGYVHVKPVMEEESRYFVYQLTIEGNKFAKEASIDKFLKAIRDSDSKKRSK